MNLRDEFWFWSSTAISEPNGSNRFFYFDEEKNLLFALVNDKHKMIPFFRNELTKMQSATNLLFNEEIKRIQQIEKCILLLPRLSVQDKKGFLADFSKTVNDDELRKCLSEDAEGFSETDKFDFKIELGKINKKLSFNFDVERGGFIASKVKECFFPLGVSEETKVVW